MASSLTVGTILTLLAWLGLQIAVIHGKYVVERDNIAEAIVSYAKEHNFDTVVLGAAGEGILRRVLFGEISETVGEQFDGQVVMARKHRPVQSAVRSFVQKWVGKGAKATDVSS